MIGVIYLVRRDHDDLESFDRFLRSYQRHTAGVEHRLILVFKGGSYTIPKQAFDVTFEAITMVDTGYYMEAFYEAALQTACQTLCFLNSKSEILCDNWLKLLTDPLNDPQIGLVGSTGSWESFAASGHPLMRLIKRIGWPAFPNPHIRTNGFGIRRNTFLHVWPERIRTKIGAHLFESGRQSFTRRVEAIGYKAMVAGKNPIIYGNDRNLFIECSWPYSQTFRGVDNQNNCIIGDNQTRYYESCDPLMQAKLRKMAWGK